MLSVPAFFFLQNKSEENISAFGELRRMKVIIDAGHGGEDGGAVSDHGVLEKDINLAVSLKLEKILNLFGVHTDMIRREDSAIGNINLSSVRERKVSDMRMRVQSVLETPDAVLVSVHQNSFPQDKSCCGAQVFFSPNNVNSEVLAENIRQSLQKIIGRKNNREIKNGGKDIYLLKNVNCPAVLVECGFLTNDEESKLLLNEIYRTKLAIGMAAGFLKMTEK